MPPSTLATRSPRRVQARAASPRPPPSGRPARSEGQSGNPAPLAINTVAHHDTRTAANAAGIPSGNDSMINCRVIRERRAPSATRTPNSARDRSPAEHEVPEVCRRHSQHQKHQRACQGKDRPNLVAHPLRQEVIAAGDQLDPFTAGNGLGMRVGQGGHHAAQALACVRDRNALAQPAEHLRVERLPIAKEITLRISLRWMTRKGSRPEKGRREMSCVPAPPDL